MICSLKKKTKCNNISLYIMLMMTFTMCNPFASFAGENTIVEYREGVDDGAIYFNIATGTITDCDESVTKATIPESINNIRVERIGEDAFSYCENLTSITIPKSIESIGAGAFANCNHLLSIIIPEGVTSIERATFLGCKKLEQVNIPKGVKSIGRIAFFQARNIKRIVLPDGITSIDSEAFEGCQGLTEIVIPKSVTYIGGNAFWDCGLKNIDLPPNITAIESGTFGLCDFKTVIIPRGVKRIENFAFYSCRSLENIRLPKSVEKIGDDAFSYCKKLQDITIPINMNCIGNNAFNSCEALKKIRIPKSVNEIGWNAFIGCEDLTIYGDEGSFAELYAKQNEKNFKNMNFELGYDNNRYVNNNEVEFGFKGVNSYALDEEYFRQLVSHSSRGEINKIKKKMNQTWNGACYGIASTMGLLFEGYIGIEDLTDSKAMSYHKLDYPNPLGDKKLLNMITFYQLSQFLNNGGSNESVISRSYNVKNWGGVVGTIIPGDTLEDCLNSLVVEAKSGKAFLLGYSSFTSSHAVLAIGYKYDDVKNEHVVKLYDENSVFLDNGSFSEMRISKNFSNFKIMNHKDDDKIDVSNITYTSLYFLDWNKMKKINGEYQNPLPYTLKASSTNEYVNIEVLAGKKFVLKNQKGEYLSFDGKQFKGTMPIYDLCTFGSDHESSYSIKVDFSARYFIDEMQDDMEISICNSENYASIKGNGIENALISFDKISAVGDTINFDAYLSSEVEGVGESPLIRVSGEAKENVQLERQEEEILTKSTNNITKVESSTYVTTESHEEKYEPSKEISIPLKRTPISSIIVEPSEKVLYRGYSVRLNLKIAPVNATEKTILWNSENPEIASVTQDGLVQGNQVGKTKVIASTKNKKHVAVCNVTIIDASQGGLVTNPSFLINVDYTHGGRITPASLSVSKNSTQTFTITPDSGYEIADVLIDGKSVGAVSAYTFENVTSNHTISATFKKKEKENNKDFEAENLAKKIKAAKDVKVKASSSQGVNKNGKRYIKVKWTKKGAAVTGYQVYRSFKKKSSYKKFYTTKRKYYYNTKALKKGKRHYYKVRAYTVIGGKKYYSKWSNLAYRTVKK